MSSRQFSFFHPKIELMQILLHSLSKISLYVHRHGQHKKSLQTFHCPLSIKASFLFSSPRSLLTTLVLLHTAAALSPSASFFFSYSGSFFFFFALFHALKLYFCRTPYFILMCACFVCCLSLQKQQLKLLC